MQPNWTKEMRKTTELLLPDTIKDNLTCFGRFNKRALDIIASLLCLILFSPLFLFCYIIIKKDDSGKAVFSQERIGKNGKPFMIYKFRTMAPNAEASGVPQLFDQKKDPRLTRAGKFLRTHHLDELPQFWNVLKGDMSLIGYRPERQFFIDQIMEKDPRYKELYQIRPGITSYATLYNGYTDTLDKMLVRLHYDLYYVCHRSFLFDCKVLWLTFWNIATGKVF